MPAESAVESFPQSFTRHESFRGAALFSRAAVEDDGAGPAGFLQPLFHGGGRSERAGTQQVMAAAMPASSGKHRIGKTFSRLLAQPAEGIKLAQYADDGVPAAVAAAKGGLNAADVFRDGKAQLPQFFAVEGCCAEFLQAQFRIFPDFV